MRYYLIAGEASGDLHGSHLMKALAKKDEDAEFRFFGGDLMQSTGGDLVGHYRDMAYMGILDVLLHIRTIKRNMESCKKDLMVYQPDVLILIDYPGFNLRIADFAKKNNIRVFYYISPKIWAWKEHRVKKIKALVDEMFTIFPFETSFYERHGYKVHYVGNPLMDSMEDYGKNAVSRSEFLKRNNLDGRPLVALLGGSREKEVKRILPVMLRAVEGITDFQVVVAGVDTVDSKVYNTIIGERTISLVYGQTYDLLNCSFAGLVASGTAALEAALFKLPQAVLYRVEGGLLIDLIMRNFVLKTNWVSLPNIILGKTVVKEFIQKDMTVKNVKGELMKLLHNNRYRENIMEDYNKVELLMGEAGCALRAAEKMVELLQPVK